MNRKLSFLALGLVFSMTLFASGYKPSVAEQKRVVSQFRKQGLVEDLHWSSLSESGRYAIKSVDCKVGTLFFRQLIPKMERFTYYVLLDEKGVVLSFGILSYTSRYGAAIGKSGWGSSFQGKRVDDLRLGKGIDAISGATLSLNALSADLQKCVRML